MSKLGLQIDSQARAEKFITEIQNDGFLFYVLKGDGSAEISASNDFSDEEERPCVVIPFWSQKFLPYAQIWADGAEIQELSLEDFIEFWLPGMMHDHVIVGLNWDQHGIGSECQPIDILNRLAESKL